MKDLSGYLIMSDLDGTFLGKNYEKNVEAVRRFQAEGGLFSFSSGRPIFKMMTVFPAFQELINSPALLCNGGCVYDPVTKGYLYETRTDSALLRPIEEMVERDFPGVTRLVYTGNYTYHENVPTAELPEGGWNKVVMVSDDPDTLHRIHVKAEAMAGTKLNYMYSCPTFLEMFTSRFTKGTMLQFIKGWYAAKGRRLTVCAIGDYENDYDMLLRADRSFCPANAIDKVKAVSDRVLCHHDEGAVAELIELLESEI